MTNHFQCLLDLDNNKEMYLLSKYVFDVAFNPHFSDSLFLVVTYMTFGDEQLLHHIKFSDYKNIYLVDVADPPDYQVEKWQLLKSYFHNFTNVYAIGHLSDVYTFPALFLEASAMWMFNDRVIAAEYPRDHLKKFTCLTGKMHDHRKELVKRIEQDDLVKDCFFAVPYKYYLPSENQSFTNSVINDMHSRKGICPVSSTIPLENFQSPINLVSETSISNNLILISEKTIKAIMSQQSILLSGNPSSIKLLQTKYGFKNLSFLPTAIDDEKHYPTKIKHFLSFLKDTSLKQLNEMYKRNEDSFAFNKENLNNFNSISINSFLKQAEGLIHDYN